MKKTGGGDQPFPAKAERYVRIVNLRQCRVPHVELSYVGLHRVPNVGLSYIGFRVAQRRAAY